MKDYKLIRRFSMTDTTYNGWTNYETWNVALWLDNDRYYYDLMMMQSVKTFKDFLEKLQSPLRSNLDASWDYKNFTGDNISWNDPKINIEEINEKIMELKEN
tara:strand:- start:305 stop:610 length:306 start_codon:yes stop_codon:yes gene_type:complete